MTKCNTPQNPDDSPQSILVKHRELIRSLVAFTSLTALIWIVLFAVYIYLPGLQNGSDQIYNAKEKFLKQDNIFHSDKKIKVVIFGDSKVLTGFMPKFFDELSEGQTESFNLGLPNSHKWVSRLKLLVKKGEKPDYVLLTTPWPETYAKNRLFFGKNTSIMRKAFPFRSLLRDVTLFFLRSKKHDGPINFYRKSIEEVQKMIQQRGYYFIYGQSHFPGHRLPENFNVETDTPNLNAQLRDANLDTPLFKDLLDLSIKEQIKLIFIPIYFRDGQYAPAQDNKLFKSKLKPYEINIMGPEYWLLPNKFFSDPMHLNHEGAQEYTRRLWKLLKKELARNITNSH